MKKIVRMSIYLLCIALFAGCGNVNLEVTHPEEYIAEIPYNLTIETWNPTTGHPTTKKATPLFEVRSTASGEVWINETQYTPLSYLWNRKDTIYTSGWKIQLDKLYHIETSAYGYIYSSDCENPPVIFTHNPFLGDVALYFRPDIAENGVATFSIDEFNITENNSPYNNEEIHNFWNVHTGYNEYDFFSGAWSDASWGEMKSYFVMLEHKEFPAITYQMKFCIYENFLIIENINTKTVIYVKLADIQP